MKPVEIINRYFEAFKTGNIDGVMDLLDENVIWNVAGVPNVPTVGLIRGKEKVRVWMEIFPEKFQPLDFVIERYFTDDSDVLVTGRFRHMIIPTDRVAGSDLIIRFTVKNELICRYQIFEDSAILSQAFDIDFPWRSYKQRINGRAYAYDDTHVGAPLIFTHGLFVNRSFFSDQVTSLSASHRCINIDFPGHGESETPEGSWALEDVADDLATPLSLSKEIAKGVTNSCLETLPGVGHHAPLGACPRIGILFKIEKFRQNKHSHMFDIASIIFLGIPKRLRKRAFSDSLLEVPETITALIEEFIKK